jgi:universal stress protein A
VNLLEAKSETEIAISNILFATDFSDISEAALPYVTALSLRYGSMVHVAHVLPEVLLLRPGAPDPAVFGSIYEDTHSSAQEKMQQICSRFRGFPHHSYVRHGKVCDVLSDIVQQQQIDLVVLGTHGRTGLGKLFMGSVAEEIFRQAACPVLTVGPRVPSTANVREARHDRELPPVQIKFHQILCATDLKSTTMRGPAYAFSLSHEFRTKLTVLHVIENYGGHLHERPRRIDTALRSLEELIPMQRLLHILQPLLPSTAMHPSGF